MIEQEACLEILDKIAENLPEEFFRELNGGIILRPEAKLHPENLNRDLWILGEYHNSKNLGRYINIYYGSFEKVYGNLEYAQLEKQLRHTLLHEFRHHLESLAGERDLEIVDAVALAHYHEMAKRGYDNTRRTQDD